MSDYVKETTELVEKREWKVGDIVYSWGNTNMTPRLETVLRITPKGWLVTDKGCTYYPNGKERTSDIWRSRHMEYATNETITKYKESLKKKRLLYCINNTDLSKLSLEQLRRINNIIKETGDKG